MTTVERLDNINPLVFEKAENRITTDSDWDDLIYDPFDAREIFDLIRNINDPEHPLSLEELNVVIMRKLLLSFLPLVKMLNL